MTCCKDLACSAGRCHMHIKAKQAVHAKCSFPQHIANPLTVLDSQPLLAHSLVQDCCIGAGLFHSRLLPCILGQRPHFGCLKNTSLVANGHERSSSFSPGCTILGTDTVRSMYVQIAEHTIMIRQAELYPLHENSAFTNQESFRAQTASVKSTIEGIPNLATRRRDLSVVISCLSWEKRAPFIVRLAEAPNPTQVLFLVRPNIHIPDNETRTRMHGIDDGLQLLLARFPTASPRHQMHSRDIEGILRHSQARKHTWTSSREI